MDETKVTESNTRTRINLSQTAKGLITFDITAEYDTPEKSIEMLGKAVDQVKALIAEKGLKSVDDVA
jgi:hypothetical protein